MSKNRYEVLGNLGCGATSRVDKARDTVLGRTVALKTLVHSFGAPTEQKQFLREAQIVSQPTVQAEFVRQRRDVDELRVAGQNPADVIGRLRDRARDEASTFFGG